MISAITGTLERVGADRVQLGCGAMVYDILVPAADIGQLKSLAGGEVTLYTIFDLEGDATRGGLTPRLIGFLRLEDKQFFQLFVTVKGIGPKRALRALVRPTGQIAAAIEAKNSRFLVELPEIGKRMAELIVAELAGKAGAFASAGAAPAAISAHSVDESEALDAAVQLGIPRVEAERLLERSRQVSPNVKSAESMLREMLRLRTARV
jgi:Holliday junction DNA helicase RuvA